MINPDTIFSFCSTLAMIGWILLILSNWIKLIRPIIITALIPILLSIVYGYIIIMYFGDGEGGFGSLDDVMLLFTHKYSALAGWIHYLAFDLWLGTWELSDSKKHGIHPVIMIPILLCTFMLGPLGLVLYFILRAIVTKKLIHNDNF